MKTFEHDGKTFIVKTPSMRVENWWQQRAIGEDGNFIRECVRNFTNNAEDVNEFMRMMVEGDHDGIDWYDAPRHIVAEVFADFFTEWSERTIKVLDTLSGGSEQKPSSDSENPLPSVTALSE